MLLSMKFKKYYLCQAIIFVLTFLSYALLHANRKSFSNLKPTLEEEWTPYVIQNLSLNVFPSHLWRQHHLFATQNDAEIFLGILDTIFMSSYAIGLYLNGYIGDIIDPRWVLGVGMISSAFSIIIFGVVTEFLSFYNKIFYAFMFALNGFFQSTGWPSAVAIMANWFGHSRGLWMGIWSSNASVGNVIGGLLTAHVLGYGYEYGFLVPAVALIIGGKVIMCGIVTHPDDLASKNKHYKKLRTSIDINDDSESVQVEKKVDVHSNKRLSLLNIILIPGVVPYAVAYACLKLVNYAFFFWLVEYLSNNFGWSNALSDLVSIWYDIGGIIGGIITGIISDLMWSRSPITVLSLVLTIPALFVYKIIPGIIWKNALFMAIVGGLINGPANLISSAISADLGSQPLLSGNKAALATVTGFIDGTGSVGAAIGQVCIPVIKQRYNWEAVFSFFMIMIAATVICITPVLVKDIARLIRTRRNQYSNVINEASES